MIATSVLKVEEAQLNDAEGISYVGKTSFAAAFGHLFNSQQEMHDYLRYTYDPAKIILSILKENNLFYVARNQSHVIGFAKMKRHSLNPQIDSVAQCELQKIYVLPEFHGSGAGQLLLDTVVESAEKQNPDYLWLDTHILNSRAIHFYEKNGFSKYGKHFFTIGTQTFEYDLMVKKFRTNFK